MRYSHTAITELSKKYRSILIKCALFNLAVVISVPAVSATYGIDVTTNSEYADTNISGDTAGIFSGSGSVGTFTGSDIDVTAGSYGVWAKDTGSKIIIGSADDAINSLTISGGSERGIRANLGGEVDVHANTISITGTDDMYGVHAYSNGSKISLNAKQIDINVENQTGVIANTDGVKVSPSTEVSLVADNINISSNVTAVAGMSEGVVRLSGNTTLNAKNAILGRGGATIAINTAEGDADKTLKMNGNIDFNYDKKTSGSPIDAHINVNLNGADSYWNGNTTMTWGNVRPTDDYLKVTQAVVTLNDGAKWNVAAIEDSDTGAQIALNNLIMNNGEINVSDSNAEARIEQLTINGGTINNTGKVSVDTMNVSGELTLNGKVTGGNVTFKDGSTLVTALDDTTKIDATNVTIGDSALKLIVDSGVEEKSYNFITADTISGAFKIEDNGLYSFKQVDGNIEASKKSENQIAEETGASVQDTTALLSLIAVNGAGSEQGNELASALSNELQSGNPSKAIQGTKDVAPSTSQYTLGLSQNLTNMFAGIAGTRMGTSAVTGTNGGDISKGTGVWAQGIYNHSKRDITTSNDGFSANSHGLAVGADYQVSPSVTIGLGYGYTDTDADSSGRDLTVDGHNVFAYGEYQPSEWYINTVLNYGFAKYKEKKAPMGIALRSEYDVNSYAAQIMTGYDFANGLTPEVGMRYLLVDTDSYSDGVQRIRSERDDVLTAVAGVKYAKPFTHCCIKWNPSVRLAATYDIISDNSKANVAVLGGGNYQIDGQRLHRFGVEAGAGITASIKNLDLTLEYNGAFRQDYRSQGGMLKAKYNF